MFKTLFSSVLMIFLTCMTTPAKSQTNNEHIFPESGKEVLVLAEVIRSEESGRGVLSTLRIGHVYWGSDDFLAKTFIAYSSSGSDSIGSSLFPSLQLGEKGIWLLKETPQGDLANVARSRFGVRWPAREGVSPRYVQMRALAEAIEMVYKKVGAQDLSEMLKKYVASDTSEISSWAIQTLAELKPESFIKLLDDIAPEAGLTVSGQITLDEVLSRLKGETWQDSAKRLSMLQKLVATKLSKYDAEKLITRLDVSSQHKEIGRKALLDLLTTAMANEEIDLSVRYNCAFLVGMTAKRNEEYGDSFNILVQVIHKEHEKDIQLGAAHAIKNFIALNDERIRTLRTLIGEINNEEIAAPLKEALKRAGAEAPELNKKAECNQAKEPEEHINWLLFGIIVMAVILAGAIVFLLLRRKGRSAA